MDAHARYMSGYDSNLGDWKSSLKKIRDTVHRIFPRELSPTRLMEKYQSDSKKKDAAKLSKLASSADAANAVADASLAQKISLLQSVALPGASTLAPSTTGAEPVVQRAQSDSIDYLPWIAGGALVLGILFAVRK